MKKYESPKLLFNELETFEDIAAECWAKPSLYKLVDPDLVDGSSQASYDLAGFTTTNNGCNPTMKDKVIEYLKETDGWYKDGVDSGTTSNPTLSDEDINIIMSSGGGNMGTSLKTSPYIIKVRS